MDGGVEISAEAALRPEQRAALGYARRRGSEAPLEAIRSRLAGTFAEIEALVASLGSAAAARRPEPGRWSVHEVVDHLVESDRRGAEQLAHLVAGRAVAAHVPAGLQSADPAAIGWDELRARFAAVHREILETLDRATDATPLEATAPVEMVVRCAGDDGSSAPVHWLQRFDWKAFAILVHAHNREHIGQIRRALDAAGSVAGAARPAPGTGPE